MSHTTTSPAPPMKDMLKDMYEMVDSVLDHQGIGHAESLEKMGKRSNAKFLQLNICLMMRAFQSVIADQPADTPCNECHEELKEEKYALYLKWSDLNDENKNIKHELNESTDCVVSMIKMKEENEELKL